MSYANVDLTHISRIPVLEIRGQPKQEEKPKAPPVYEQPTNEQVLDLKQLGQAFNKKLQYVIDHNSNQLLVKVIDKETDKVIKVIPPEELQRVRKNLNDAKGLFLNEMV
jgi:flagellar protein FlaG